MSRQLGARVSDGTAEKIQRLGIASGSSSGKVIDRAVALLYQGETQVRRGALNESEKLEALACLEGFEHTPSPGRAVYFLKEYGFRLLDTALLAARNIDNDVGSQPVPGTMPHIGGHNT